MRTSGVFLRIGRSTSAAGVSPRNISPDSARLPCLTLGISTNWVAEPMRSLVPSATTARICQAPGPGSFIWKESRSPCSIAVAVLGGPQGDLAGGPEERSSGRHPCRPPSSFAANRDRYPANRESRKSRADRSAGSRPPRTPGRIVREKRGQAGAEYRDRQTAMPAHSLTARCAPPAPENRPAARA